MKGRRARGALAVAVLAAGCAAIAAPAHAAQTGSALDQYLEDVPGAGDDRSTLDTLGGSAVPLDPEATQALEQLGPRGEQALALAEQTRPESAARGHGDQPSKDGDGGGAGVGTVAVDLLDPSGSGIGLALPLILIGTLVAGIAFALSRRSRGPGPA
jgi:hypothetical protein